MKQIRNIKGTLITFRVLALIIIALVIVLIAGTIYSFARPSESGPLFRIGKNTAPAKTPQNAAETNANIFTGIGRLRIPLSGSSTLILSIAFPYPADDRAFTEELAAKIGDLRSMAIGYFSSLPQERIINLNEEEAKTEILRQYNTILRLGKIQTLYFDDLMVIE